MKRTVYLWFLVLIFIASCGSDENNAPSLQIIASDIDGASITPSISNVSISPVITISFSAAIDPTRFEGLLSIMTSSNSTAFQVSYQNASTKAIISTTLAFNTTYDFLIPANEVIGVNGEVLAEAFQFSLTTREDDIIRSLPPCTNGVDCIELVDLSTDSQEAYAEVFSNYPIYAEDASWEELTAAVILVHGANRNSDDYFNWMTTTFQSLNVSDQTILIAPSFRVSAEAKENEVYWSSNDWREGANSASSTSVSSFAVIDSLIHQLQNAARFPVLKKIIVTGHSSGGLFTHAYAAANQVDSNNPDTSIEYIVANSQYFYYPDGERIDESNNALYTPTNCSVYDNWPLGFEAAPPYLSASTLETVNNQFINRSITYLLGNGNDPDPSLNTSACDATLLGSTRFTRGENMFRYMELKYADSHSHKKEIVEGIGHDGQRMYQSDEFEDLLISLLPE